MSSKTPTKGHSANAKKNSHQETQALTPAQKRRLRKKKLEEKLEEEKSGVPTAAATATPAASAKKPKGRKVEPTPAFVPSAHKEDDESSESDSDDSDAGNIITAENVQKKKSIAALSAAQVLKEAERQKQLLGEASAEDESDEEVLVKKGSKKSQLDESSDDEEENSRPTKKQRTGKEESLTINKEYAKKFEEEKRKQTLSKKGSRGDVVSTLLREAANAADDVDSEDELVGDLKAQLRKRAASGGKGSDDEDDDESSGSSEDEDGLLLTKDVDAKIASTMQAIRAKKPEVYDSAKAFFTEADLEKAQAEAKKAKAAQGSQKSVGVKELLSKQLLDESDDSDEDGDEEENLTTRGRMQKLQAEKESASKGGKLTYTQQQQKLKEDFLKLADNEGDSDEDEDVFKVKSKTVPTSDGDSDDEPTPATAAKSVGGKRGKLESKKYAADGSAKGVDAASNPNDFLQSYLSQEWWKQRDLSKLPSYKDIRGEDLPPEYDEQEDDAVLEKTDLYEQAYNFRYEEPNSAYQIKSYPRPQLIEDSLRKDESKRKQQRDAVKEKKEQEKLKKKEEIARLKAEKRKDLTKKIKELEEIAGLGSNSVTKKMNLNDFLTSWDPSKHDELMSSLFNDEEFYNDAGADEQLDEEQLREQVLKGEDMSALGMGKLPSAGNGESKKKKKLSSDAADAFNATSNQIKRTMDEYQDLDAEGLVGTKTTFRWKQVEPSSFGMSIEEILALPDRELNAKVSMKKLATYREDGDVDYVMPHKRKRDEKLARVNAKMAKRDAWKKGHATPAAASSSTKKEQPKTPKPATTASGTTATPKPAGSSTTPTSSAPLSASQKRRQRKKKLEELSGAEKATQGEPKKAKLEK